MEMYLTEEHHLFRDLVRKFAQKEVEPLVEEGEREQTIVVLQHRCYVSDGRGRVRQEVICRVTGTD